MYEKFRLSATFKIVIFQSACQNKEQTWLLLYIPKAIYYKK